MTALNSILAGVVLVSSFAALAVGGDRVIVGFATAIDGDTIRIDNTRIRLFGIDAPEAAQTCIDHAGRAWSCGEAATAAMGKMLAEGPVSCVSKGTDRYGRTVATCTISAVRTDIGGLLVALGLAVDVPRYSGGAYRDEQAAAQAEKMGIWSGTFEMPTEWRGTRR